MRWRAWYADRVGDDWRYLGTTFTSDNTDWQSLPTEGLLWVVTRYEDRRVMHHSGDWYWKEGDRIQQVPSIEWGKDEPYPEQVRCKSCVKRGVGVPDDDFRAVRLEAFAWP